METKTTDFSVTLQYKGNTRPLCIFSLPPNPSLYFLKTGSILQGEGCSCKVMEIPKGVCFSSSQPNWKSAEESSSGPRPDLTGNFNLAKLVLVSTSSSDVSRKTDFDSTSREFLNGLKDGKAFIDRERKTKTSGVDNFWEKLLAEGISKNAAELITSAKRKSSAILYELAWKNRDSYCSRKQVDLLSELIN